MGFKKKSDIWSDIKKWVGLRTFQHVHIHNIDLLPERKITLEKKNTSEKQISILKSVV